MVPDKIQVKKKVPDKIFKSKKEEFIFLGVLTIDIFDV